MTDMRYHAYKVRTSSGHKQQDINGYSIRETKSMTGNRLVLNPKVCEQQKVTPPAVLPKMRSSTTEALMEEHRGIRTPDRRNNNHSSLKNTKQSM